MPKHDLPDGHETAGNLIDIRAHLRRRADASTQQDDQPERPTSDWDVYRHAEYGDGERPRLGRYDLLWLGLIVSIGWIFWRYVFH